eukprot:252222-Chlamydomonas_euryale.AAC.2
MCNQNRTISRTPPSRPATDTASINPLAGLSAPGGHATAAGRGVPAFVHDAAAIMPAPWNGCDVADTPAVAAAPCAAAAAHPSHHSRSAHHQLHRAAAQG